MKFGTPHLPPNFQIKSVFFNFPDKITSYTDYVHSLERLTAFVSRREISSAEELEEEDESSRCASVSRMNNALFHPRLHFECPEAMEGRFVYLKAEGLKERWRSQFNLVLCEVMVY